MFKVDSLSFAYDRQPLFEDLSFSLSSGETVALVGPNGVGKTSLLRLLVGLAVPMSGRIFLDNIDALKYPVRFRRQLGYMPENPAFEMEMSVKAYLRYRAVLRGENHRKIRHRVQEVLENCALLTVADECIARLSFGHRRLLALADALLLRPRILLLDDPFAGLDPLACDLIVQTLSSVADFTSVLIAGHGLALLEKCASRFLVLRDGLLYERSNGAGVLEALK